ncbi:hypothetical protein B7P43_G07939 [Cryptotermes secundus]|nr:hypothetical protein B7P43_G07939 [Cryptotermes secundus]
MRDDPNMTDDMMGNMMTTSVAEFQMFFGLEPTGQMDEATHEVMTKPRCGLKDKHDYDEEKSFAPFGSPWKKQNLSYAILTYPSNKDLLAAAVDEEMEKAFAVWSAVTELNFLLVASNMSADVMVTFASRAHGDGMPFDGAGKVLAHAFPSPTGIVHFDDDEPWTIRKYRGENLFYIAVHEFGHALGLDHSNVTESVMYPMVAMYDPAFRLHREDIQHIQALYGRRTRPPPDLCSDPTFDAIFQYPAGVIYILKGEYYWKVAADGPVSWYPKLISHHWHGLPGNIDAAFALPSGKIYFLKGDKTWAYKGSSLLPKYPRLISDVWKGIPKNVDAAMYYDESTFFFFKGDSYWKYILNEHHDVNTDTYPKPLSRWDGIIQDLDDVLRIGDYVYFFRKGRYYRFNCITHLVDQGYPDLPDYHRPTGPWWFRCRENGTEDYNHQGPTEPGHRNVTAACPTLHTAPAVFVAILTLSLGQL